MKIHLTTRAAGTAETDWNKMEKAGAFPDKGIQKGIIVMRETTGLPSQEKPWMQFFPEGADKVRLPEESIYQHLRKVNENHREDVAIRYFSNRITYGKLLDDIDQCAAAFASLGVKKGDIVVFLSITVPELVVALYALNKLGAAPMVLDPRNTATSVSKFMKDANSTILVSISVTAPIREMAKNPDVKKLIVYSAADSMSPGLVKWQAARMMKPDVDFDDRVVTWQTFMDYGKGKTTETVDYKEFQLAGIALTGGTTGAPKGVMFSNDGFNAIALDFQYCGVEYDRSHKFMNIIPAFASYGMVASLHMPLSLGLEMIIIPKFDSDQVGKYVKQYRPQHTLMVPAHYEKLMNSKEMRGGFRLDFFITAGSGGDTMNEGLEMELNRFLKERGAKFPLSQGYGLSEVSSAAACSCNGNFRSMSVGYPLLMNTVGVFKPGTTEELGYRQEGEICITGPAVMLGYLNNQEATDKMLIRHPDGKIWVHSGDLGAMDTDGYIYIKGRIKRMITMFNGHKVFPTYIEDVISKHPEVQSVAVVGVRDRRHAQGQRVHAVVQLKESSRPREQVLPELQDLMKAEIEASVIPETVEFIREMPRAGMGKIDYLKLSQDYDARTANEAE